MQTIKNFFDYLCENDARGYIFFGFVFLIIFEIVKNGLSNLINFILNLPLLVIAAMFVSFIECIFYIVWNHDTNTDCELLENGKAAIMFYSNCCIFLYLYFAGTVSWS